MKLTQKGFSLVELLVVISIIGLLATLSIVSLSSARVKARDAKRVSDIRQIQTAMELYFSDNNAYPESDGAAATLGVGNYLVLTSEGFKALADAGDTVYMGKVPANPTPGGVAYTYLAREADKSVSPDNSTTVGFYEMTFTLETAGAGLPAGNHIATPEGMN